MSWNAIDLATLVSVAVSVLIALSGLVVSYAKSKKQTIEAASEHIVSHEELKDEVNENEIILRTIEQYSKKLSYGYVECPHCKGKISLNEVDIVIPPVVPTEEVISIRRS